MWQFNKALWVCLKKATHGHASHTDNALSHWGSCSAHRLPDSDRKCYISLIMRIVYVPLKGACLWVGPLAQFVCVANSLFERVIILSKKSSLQFARLVVALGCFLVFFMFLLFLHGFSLFLLWIFSFLLLSSFLYFYPLF